MCDERRAAGDLALFARLGGVFVFRVRARVTAAAMVAAAAERSVAGPRGPAFQSSEPPSRGSPTSPACHHLHPPFSLLHFPFSIFPSPLFFSSSATRFFLLPSSFSLLPYTSARARGPAASAANERASCFRPPQFRHHVANSRAPLRARCSPVIVIHTSPFSLYTALPDIQEQPGRRA